LPSINPKLVYGEVEPLVYKGIRELMSYINWKGLKIGIIINPLFLLKKLVYFPTEMLRSVISVRIILLAMFLKRALSIYGMVKGQINLEIY